MIEIELPTVWNEKEVSQRLQEFEIEKYEIIRDYTETGKDGVTTTYYPARLILYKERIENEREVVMRLANDEYSQTQEDYQEETRIDPIRAIEARLVKIEEILKIDAVKP